MATAKAQQTREQWQARALELAAMHQTLGTARYVTADAKTLTVRVPSATHSEPHVVVVTRATGATHCDCLAGQHQIACRHAGAALAYLPAFERAFEEDVREEVYREDWDAKDYLLMRDYERQYGDW